MPEDYFLQIRGIGRPTYLLPDEEQLIANMLSGLGKMTSGKDKTLTLKMICRVATAVGNPRVKGSARLFQAFIARSKVAAKEEDGQALKHAKASNLSKLRAKALIRGRFVEMFTKFDAIITRLREQGRLGENELLDPDTIFNSDEAHPGQGNFNAVVVGADTERAFRIVEGEKVEWHASAVITTSGLGELVRPCCGVVHQATGKTCRGDLAEGLPVGRDAPFFALTPGGGMDEASFLDLAKIFAFCVGKQKWDCSQPWDNQPAADELGFEPRPIMWLLDAHYSHTCPKVLEYCRDHDIIVFFTVAGASEIDQVCDCGIMACLQADFGSGLTQWRETHPSIPFEQWNWNTVYTAALRNISHNRGSSMRSAWAKTGWYPYVGLKAANYQNDIFLASAVLVDSGAQNVETVSDVPLVAQTTEVVTLSSARPGDSKAAVIRKAAYDAINTTVVKPVAELRHEYEKINKLKRMRTTTTANDDDDEDDESDTEADNTRCGNEGTSAAFIGRRNRVHAKRQVKAQKKEEAAAAKQLKATDALNLAISEALVIEQRLDNGATVMQLKVTELKALLKARGGSISGKKDVLQARLLEKDESGALKLKPMSAESRAAVVAMSVGVPEEGGEMAEVAAGLEAGFEVDMQPEEAAAVVQPRSSMRLRGR